MKITLVILIPILIIYGNLNFRADIKVVEGYYGSYQVESSLSAEANRWEVGLPVGV